MTTAPMERADEQIQRDVLEELKWDAFVPIEKLEITVSKGWVTLKGDVEWEYQRRTAERAVRRLAGAWPAPVESPISSQSVPGSPRNHRI
jgi:osmotically-inducible protein OsmY